jgi:hypothetical protein
MRRYGIGYWLVIFFACSLVQAQERLYSVSLSSSFTTTAKLFYAPDDPDLFIRQQHHPIDNVIGFGIDIRRSMEETSLQIGLSAEYLSKSEQFTIPRSSDRVSDGFIAVPMEITGYFIIPFSSETMQLYMGGGGGVYWGTRKYEYNTVRALTVERNLGYGIHILSGIQYSLSPVFAVRSELKFRDVQFNVSNAFPPTSRDRLYPDSGIPFPSRISIDGINLSIALVTRF